jgi:hypothetical protein
MKTSLPALLVLGLTLGCGPAARGLARDTTPGIIEGGVEAIVDEETQKTLVRGIDEEIIAEKTDRLLSGALDGALRALDDERSEDLRRGVAALTGEIVDESFSRLTSDENRDKVRAGVRGMMRDMIGAVADQSREELDGKNIGAMLSGGTRELAKQATLGFQDAIDETRAKKEAGRLPDHRGNVLDAAGRAAEGWSTLLWLAVAGIAGFAVALLGVMLLRARRSRITRDELARRDDALIALAGAIKATEGQPWSADLRTALKDALRDDERGDYLRKVLRENRDLRLSPAAARERPPADHG